MQATRGFAVLTRPRGRVAGCLVALAVALVALAAPSGAGAVSTPVTQTDLGLGDSLAFGYSLQLYHEGEVKGFEDPENFNHGYVNNLYKSLNSKSVNKGEGGIRLINDGCPGETTGSMIGTNASLISTLNAHLKQHQE